jgi:membrane protein required for colicin V production
MDGFTIIDGIAAIVIVMSALLAYSRGLVRELMAILGWVGAAVGAYIFAPQVQPLVKELPVVGEFLTDSCELSVIASFTVVFVIILIIVSFFTPLFSTLVNRSIFGGLDQGLGFLFGVARGILLVVVAFFVYYIVSPDAITIVDQSRSAVVFGQISGEIENEAPQQAVTWVEARFNSLVGACEAQ